MQVLFQGVGWYLTESDEEHKLCQALGRDVSCHNSQAKITILLHDVCHITINSQAKITFLMCQC